MAKRWMMFMPALLLVFGCSAGCTLNQHRHEVRPYRAELTIEIPGQPTRTLTKTYHYDRDAEDGSDAALMEDD